MAGQGGDMTYLLPQMLELAKDHEVIFYDQRGSGKSLETPMNTKYINVNQFTEDLEKLRKNLGLKKFILLGHSWGGFLAMNYTIRHPQAVSSLILASTVPADYQNQLAFVKEVQKRTEHIKEEIKAFSRYDELVKMSEDDIHKLYRIFFATYLYHATDVDRMSINMSKASVLGGTMVAELMSKSYIKPNINLLPALKLLKVPTFIIQGRQDVMPLESAYAIKDAIPQAKIVVLEECGHAPYMEKPEEFFSNVRSFLNEKNYE
jgi:proline iminopeptidase